MADFIKYTHNYLDQDTVFKFLNNENRIVNDISVYDFLTLGSEGDKNIDKIFSNYDLDTYNKWSYVLNDIKHSTPETFDRKLDKKGTKLSRSAEQLPLFVNTSLNIPNDNFKAEFYSVQSRNMFLEQKDIVGFWSEKLLQILSDPLYVRSDSIAMSSQGSDAVLINQNVQVWVWCRALNKIINISAFVQSASTQKSDVGGFTINLSPLDAYKEYYELGEQNVANYFNIRESDGKVQLDYFNNYFQQNDVVFIRFEKLQLEKDNGDKEYNFEISQSELPGKIWDMIGLIDTVKADALVGNTDYSVSITGRDFLKLIVEDGSYFLKWAYIVGADGDSTFVELYNQDNKFFKRMTDSSGEAGYFDNKMYHFLSSQRSIKDSVGFIVNQLSNLGVLGEDGEQLFAQYDKSKRTSKYSIDNDSLKENTVQGVWQITKFFIDAQLDNRRLVDTSLSYADGTLLEQFNKLCQQPFVEFYGDTYGDEFNFIIRQPPFDRNSVVSFVTGNMNSTSSLKSVASYDQKNIKDKSIAATVTLPEATARPSNQNCLISITESEVFSFDLQWDETYYSWYQVNPNQAMLGKFNYLPAGGLVPIVFFTEIAETFGNHRKIVQDNYLDANGLTATNSGSNINYYREALLNDLKYLIETNIYLPFTRKGSITLTHGDRRIRKGTFVKLEQTGEIFYVDSLSNSISFTGTGVDRTTTLNVSRGMLEQYIEGDYGYDEKGEKISETQFSYFDLVDIEIINKRTAKELPPVNVVKQIPADKYDVKIPQFSTNVYGAPREIIAYRNNNPGNLKYVGQAGATQGDHNWAKFETPEEGFKALMRQVQVDQKRNLTIEKFVYKYAPPSENDSKSYVEKICLATGSKKTDNIATKDTFELSKEIAILESNTRVTRVIKAEPEAKKEKSNSSGYIYVNSLTNTYRNLVATYFPVSEVDNALRTIESNSGGRTWWVSQAASGVSQDINANYGLFQINSVKYPDYYGFGDLLNAEYNIRCAAEIFKTSGWSAWSTTSIPGVVSSITRTEKPKATEEPTSVINTESEITMKYKLNKDQYNFFLKRKQFNYQKFRKK